MESFVIALLRSGFQVACRPIDRKPFSFSASDALCDFNIDNSIGCYSQFLTEDAIARSATRFGSSLTSVTPQQ
jgi:hypothetical protein